MNRIKGGGSEKCSCSCKYVNSGGSCTQDNSSANFKGTTPIHEPGGCIDNTIENRNFWLDSR